MKICMYDLVKKMIRREKMLEQSSIYLLLGMKLFLTYSQTLNGSEEMSFLSKLIFNFVINSY